MAEGTSSLRQATHPPKKNNKEVSSDKQAAPLGLLQPAQQQTRSLSRDNVPALIANDFMDVILFDEESSDVSSDNAAAILYLAVFTPCTVGNLRTTPLSDPVSI